MRTPENVEWVRQAILRSPRRFAWAHSGGLQISNRTVRILHGELHFHPYNGCAGIECKGLSAQS